MLKKDGLKRAFQQAAKHTLLAAGVTTGIGIVTGDFSAVVPAATFAFITAMGVAGKYERMIASTKPPKISAPSPD